MTSTQFVLTGFVIAFVIGMFMLVPIIIGIGIYRDVKKRGKENALLWALLGIFVPLYLGLVMYLFFEREKDNQD